ncbi:hypothetical protein IH601_07085 [Candidatus Bipolaricaulota bacterium]|nr:hypothetical protein [Candidatus Bipolaricaulota bacterium]
MSGTRCKGLSRFVYTTLLLLGVLSFLAYGLGGSSISSSESGSTVTLPSTTVNTEGSATTFTITGTNLTPADGILTVTAPADVEISLDGASWGSSFTVSYTGSTIGPFTVYVRLAAIPLLGLYRGNVVIAGGGADSENQAVSGAVAYVPVYASADLSILEPGCPLEDALFTLHISDILDQYGNQYDPQSIEYSFDDVVYLSITLTGAAFYNVQHAYTTYGNKTITVRIDSTNILTLDIMVCYIPVYSSAAFLVTPNPSFLQNRPIAASISNIKDQKNIDYIPISAEIQFYSSGGALVYQEDLGSCNGGCSATWAFSTAGDYVVKFFIDGIEQDSLDFTILADTAAPTVNINQSGGQADPTNTASINFTVVFNEAATGFSTGDVTLSGTAGATTGTVTETGPMDGTTYTVAVGGMTGDGTVIAEIGAGVATDLASNPNVMSTSTDNTVTYDATAPSVQTVDVDTPLMGESDLTQQVTATFDEAMDPTLPPTIIFAQGTFASTGHGAWSAGDTVWTETFSLADHNEQLPGVDVDISGSKDLAGNTMTPCTKQSAFAIDTGFPADAPQASCILTFSIRTGDADPIFIWPIEDEEAAPQVGERTLFAVLEALQTTTFVAEILDAEGRPVLNSWIHVFIYAVDVAAARESLTLITHWVVHCDRILWTYPIEIDTSVLAPGYYDIYMVFPDGEPLTIRIQLVET